MELKEGYKNVEVGVIPIDWEVKSIGEIVDIDPDNLGSSTNPNYVFKYISLEDVDYGILRNISEIIFSNAPSRARRKVKKNDILVSTVRPNLKSHLLISEDVHDWICSTGFSVLRCKSDINSVFLFNHFFAATINRQIENFITGSNYPSINSKEVKALRIPIPPTKYEQDAIANVLSDTDSYINSLEKLIAKKRLIKQGTMQELLAPNEVWHSEPIKNIASISTGSKNTQDKIDDGIYPFFVRSSIIEKINSYSYDGEAVLVAGDGVGTGKVIHYFQGKFDFHQRVYKICEFSNEINGFYFYIYFKTNFLNRIMQMTAKSSVDSIRMEMISEMNIPFPSKDEQNRIVTIIGDMDSEIINLEQKLNKTKQLKNGMMQHLLTGKIRLI